MRWDTRRAIGALWAILRARDPAPGGYGAIGRFCVEICEDQKIYYYILENHPIQSLVRIEKRDIATGEVIPVAGARFQIVNEQTGEKFDTRYIILQNSGFASLRQMILEL